MRRSFGLSIIIFLFSCYQAMAQETQVTFDVTAETAVGSGDFTAYQLTANRHHVLATRPNTAYMRGAVNVEHALGGDFKLSGAIDAIGSVHADHKAYLQQCYANLSWQEFFVEAGSREIEPVVRDPQLSSGAFTKGNNAKPIPQVHFGTKDFWTVPFTNDWLQVHFDFGYGKFMDNQYKEDVFQRTGEEINNGYTKGSFYHQKHLYFRTNPEKRFFVIGGIEHVAQFGGTKYYYEDHVLVSKKKPATLKAFWNVILPLGDSQYFEHEANEDWIYGNHLGSMTVQIGWNIDKEHQVQAYVDDPFEDGSGMRKSNGWDGLYGVQYNNKAEGRRYVRSAVVEFLQTTNQSGPLHWDGGDYPEPARSQIKDKVVGNDNYYNHGFYINYSHYGMTPGTPLITSPIYNKDGNMTYGDNRVKAWHVGINGELTDQLSYMVKGSYREGWGTYYVPLVPKRHSFDAMLQGIYQTGAWQFAAAFAFDKGNIYGDCSTFNFKINYHGKIL